MAANEDQEGQPRSALTESGDLHIVVDLSERRISLYDGERRIVRSRCSIGMPGFRTPEGRWKLGSRSRTPDWMAPGWALVLGMKPGHIYKFGEPGNPYEAGLINLVGTSANTLGRTGYAIHGTHNQESVRQRLAASHGCIRVLAPMLRTLYERCPPGTPVRTRR